MVILDFEDTCALVSLVSTDRPHRLSFMTMNVIGLELTEMVYRTVHDAQCAKSTSACNLNEYGGIFASAMNCRVQ